MAVSPHKFNPGLHDDADLIRAAPVLAYLHPGRLALISDTQAFPFPAGMRK